jgi:hypothetical protein
MRNKCSSTRIIFRQNCLLASFRPSSYTYVTTARHNVGCTAWCINAFLVFCCVEGRQCSLSSLVRQRQPKQRQDTWLLLHLHSSAPHKNTHQRNKPLWKYPLSHRHYPLLQLYRSNFLSHRVIKTLVSKNQFFPDQTARRGNWSISVIVL